jgi:hypothetical protein
MINLRKYKRYVCFKALYITEKLSKDKEKELYRLNKIIKDAEIKIMRLLKDDKK